MAHKSPSAGEQGSSYDFHFSTMGEWAKERGHLQTNYESNAKQPVVPFAPLQREVGVEPVTTVEAREMTPGSQREVAQWVGRVKSPFDLIQRAEGQETPEQVFRGGQNRAVKNLHAGIEKAVVQSKSGRAAIRRQYKTTLHHDIIAKQRLTASKAAFDRMKAGQDFTEEDRKVVYEMLQELGNGLAANIDNLYPGGDGEARVAGNGIIAVGVGILDGSVNPPAYTPLMYAAAGYVRKQEKLWDKKLTAIHDFAGARGFAAYPTEDEVA